MPVLLHQNTCIIGIFAFHLIFAVHNISHESICETRLEIDELTDFTGNSAHLVAADVQVRQRTQCAHKRREMVQRIVVERQGGQMVQVHHECRQLLDRIAMQQQLGERGAGAQIAGHLGQMAVRQIEAGRLLGDGHVDQCQHMGVANEMEEGVHGWIGNIFRCGHS